MRRRFFILALAVVLLVPRAQALAPGYLKSAPTIDPNSSHRWTPTYDTQYFKLELPYGGNLTASMRVYNRDECPYCSLYVFTDNGTTDYPTPNRQRAHAFTTTKKITNSSSGTSVPLFSVSLPAGPYLLQIMSWSSDAELVLEFDCPHSNYGYTIETKAATCYETGYSRKLCNNCGASYDSITKSKLSHTFSADGWSEVKAPTCTTDGTQSQRCNIAYCGELVTRTVSKLGHDYSEWSTVEEPTCAAMGQKSQTCSRCGNVETASISKLDHDYGDWVVLDEPTCTGSGQQVRVCRACGEQDTGYISPTGHSYGNWEVQTPATCVEAGVDRCVCATCGNVQTQFSPLAQDHSYADWTVTQPPGADSFGQESTWCVYDCGKTLKRTIPCAADYMAPMGPSHLCWWTCSAQGQVCVPGLPQGYTMLAACYDGQGRFLTAKPVSTSPQSPTQLTGQLEKARLFLLGPGLVPQDVPCVIFDHPAPWPVS